MTSDASPLAHEDALSQVRAEVAKVASAADAAALEALRVSLLGRRGLFKGLMERLKDVAKAERGAFGKAVNDLRAEAEAALDRRKAGLDAAAEAARKQGFYDVTLPGRRVERGTLHPLTIVTEELLDTFARLGFTIARGPEVEEPFHNFEALNIPPDHPARDRSDNFYLDAPPGAEPRLLRSQTSTVQIRVMFDGEKARTPPFRVVAPGKVFRPDTVDATHHFQFHQVEGLAVDEGISFRDLKTTLLLFAKAMFGADQAVRLRPSFFPFTEPSAEFDLRCWICHGQGCAVCKHSGWIELGGAGMVDPNVFDKVGIDSERYTGFAFGFGIERMAMLRFGVKDLRLFTENDVRFLDQLG